MHIGLHTILESLKSSVDAGWLGWIYCWGKAASCLIMGDWTFDYVSDVPFPISIKIEASMAIWAAIFSRLVHLLSFCHFLIYLWFVYQKQNCLLLLFCVHFCFLTFVLSFYQFWRMETWASILHLCGYRERLEIDVCHP